LVCVKTTTRTKKYRIARLKIIKSRNSNKSLETIHNENKCQFKLDLNKVYFSTKTSFERQRIASLAKENEVIGVFFAGVGPYAIIVAKHSKASKIIGFELNPSACKYFKENIELNKLESKVECVKGDLKKTYKKFKNKFDRILMIHPTENELFLKHALYCLKKNGIIHFQKIVERLDACDYAIALIKKRVKKFKVLNKRLITSYSKRKSLIAIDFQVK